MLKEGDFVVFKSGMTEFLGFGQIISFHGNHVAIRYTHGPHVCFAVAKKENVYPRDAEVSEEPAVLQQVQLMVDSFLNSADAARESSQEWAQDLADRMRTFMLQMHSIGYLEGQALASGEAWTWERELQRICASFIRFYEHRVEREGPPDKGAPEAEDLCDYLVWAMTALRDGLAVSPEVFDAVSVRAKAKATEASDEG